MTVRIFEHVQWRWAPNGRLYGPLARQILNSINTGLLHRLGMMDFKFAGEQVVWANFRL
jgi:hypothetical protein